MKKKRILSILLAVAMVICAVPASIFAALSYDDTQNHWAEEAIDRWSEYSVVQGKGEGKFDPDGQMTRAEAAQVFANLLGLNKTADLSGFKDVKNLWYKEAIAKCYAAGILNGKGEGKMDPNGKITREEFITMYARAVCISNGVQPEAAKTELTQKGYKDASKVSSWAADAVSVLVDKGFVKGVSETELAPKNNINRASVMALLNQSISTYVGKESTETTVTAKSEGITLIANTAVTKVTGNADVVVVAAGAEKYNETTGEIEHNDIKVESAKMPIARVEGENITVTLTINTEADDAEVTITGVDSEIIIESTASAKNVTLSAEGSKATVAGKVETIKVEETAKEAVVDTKSTAKVETVENKAESTTVKGSGTVTEVKSSENVTIETKNTKVENTNEEKQIAVTDSKGAETKVETKQESSSTGTTTSETTVNKEEKPSGGGGGYTPPAHTHSYTYYAISETQHEGCCNADGVKTAAAAHDTAGEDSACSVCGYKADFVARIGTTYYTTLADAVSAATTGQTVVLLKDSIADSTSLNPAVTVPKGKVLTLDLNQYKFESDYAIDINGELTIEGTTGSIVGQYAVRINTDAKLTMNGGTIEGRGKSNESIGAAVTLYNEDNTKTKTTRFVMNDGKLLGSGKAYCLTLNNAYPYSEAIINKGELVAQGKGELKATCAIYWPSAGNLTIGAEDGQDSDVLITTNNGNGIEMPCGNLIVNHATITASESTLDATSDIIAYEKNYSSVGLGDAITIVSNKSSAYAKYPLNVTINGGDFSSTSDYAVRCLDCSNAELTPQAVSVEINGGRFSETGTATTAIDFIYALDKKVVKGGIFSSDPAVYTAVGYHAVAQGTEPETWKVHLCEEHTYYQGTGDSTTVYQNCPKCGIELGTENTPYLMSDGAHLRAAFKNYADPSYYKFIDDIEINWGEGSSPKCSGVIDGDGHSLSGDTYYVVDKNDGDFTLKNLNVYFGEYQIDFLYLTESGKVTFENINTYNANGYAFSKLYDGVGRESFFPDQIGPATDYTAKNCKNYANLYGLGYYGLFIGNFANHGAKISIIDCENHGDITAKNFGLILGNSNNQTITLAAIESFDRISTAVSAYVSNLVNYGEIIGTKYCGVNNIYAGDGTDPNQSFIDYEESLSNDNFKHSGRGNFISGISNDVEVSVSDNKIRVSETVDSATAYKLVMTVAFSDTLNNGSTGSNYVRVEREISEDGSDFISKIFDSETYQEVYSKTYDSIVSETYYVDSDGHYEYKIDTLLDGIKAVVVKAQDIRDKTLVSGYADGVRVESFSAINKNPSYTVFALDEETPIAMNVYLYGDLIK